ncbi:hypothetical protein CPC08DRAFT_429661 [Agrocybe pediades]|nr:hypothetical protein CPC08DRAFT_429661 [Agrocybe pediades]
MPPAFEFCILVCSPQTIGKSDPDNAQDSNLVGDPMTAYSGTLAQSLFGHLIWNCFSLTSTVFCGECLGTTSFRPRPYGQKLSIPFFPFRLDSNSLFTRSSSSELKLHKCKRVISNVCIKGWRASSLLKSV